MALITLIGTGHVFDIGARVREETRRRSPQVVAIELDKARFDGLRNKDASRRAQAPFFYRMLADFQTRIAKDYGVEAGDEMLAAAAEAQALGVPLALIDRDAQVTFQRLLREMGILERFRLAGSVLVGLVLPGKSVEAEVTAMQEDYTSYFHAIGKKFPTVKRVLLDERNEHMARALAEMSRTQDRVVAVIGDGHVDGIAEILTKQGLTVETVRLKELRRPSANTATVSFDVPSDAPPPRDP